MCFYFYVIFFFFFVFFFSSRRRHTRSKRDWSSDVCSSDLLLPRLFYWCPLPWRSHASSSFKLRHRLFAPFGVHVVEKLVAAGAADVDVDIGTIAALLVEKTLEIKAPAERADAGNAKAIG